MLILVLMAIWIVATVITNLFVESIGYSIAISLIGMLVTVVAYIVLMSLLGLIVFVLDKGKAHPKRQRGTLLPDVIVLVGAILALSYYAWDKLWLLEVGGVILAIGVAVQVYRTIRG